MVEGDQADMWSTATKPTCRHRLAGKGHCTVCNPRAIQHCPALGVFNGGTDTGQSAQRVLTRSVSETATHRAADTNRDLLVSYPMEVNRPPDVEVWWARPEA